LVTVSYNEPDYKGLKA